MSETMQEWAARKIAEAEKSPEYWQEMYEIEKGEHEIAARKLEKARAALRKIRDVPVSYDPNRWPAGGVHERGTQIARDFFAQYPDEA